MSNKKLKENKKTILAVLVLLVIWQAAAMILDQKLLLASPLQVLARFFTIWKDTNVLRTVGYSSLRIIGGFLSALLAGCGLAVLAGKADPVRSLLAPFMITIKTVPVASFIIIALVWLSSGQLSGFISFLMVLPVIYHNVLSGIDSMDEKMTELADVFRVPWEKRFRFIWLPTIRPYLVSSCNSALGMCWKSGIAAEVIGIPDGSIGEMLYQAKAYLNTVDLFTWTLIIVLISALFEKLFLWMMNKAYERYCYQ